MNTRDRRRCVSVVLRRVLEPLSPPPSDDEDPRSTAALFRRRGFAPSASQEVLGFPFLVVCAFCVPWPRAGLWENAKMHRIANKYILRPEFDSSERETITKQKYASFQF